MIEKITALSKEQIKLIIQCLFNLFLLLFLVLAFLMIILTMVKVDDYEVHYKEYIMQENDSLFNVVQSENDYLPHGWDTNDLVSLAKKKNNIENVATIPEGSKILIPITIPED